MENSLSVWAGGLKRSLWQTITGGILVIATLSLLVQGVGAQLGDGSEVTTSTVVSSPTTSVETIETIDSAQTTIQKVVYGLVVVGVLLLLLAGFYWWKTRPVAPKSENLYRREE